MLSCGKEEACTTINYEAEFNAAINQEFCLADGNSFTITKVGDSLCPCNTVCVSAGYVVFNVEVNLDGNIISGLMSHDNGYNLSSTDKIVLPDDYKIEIRDQIPASANICGGQTKTEDFNWNLVIYKK